MSISDTTETAIMALIFNATTWANYAINASASPETNISVALHTADPGDAGTQSTSEITYTGYARVNVSRASGAGGWTISGTAPTQAALSTLTSFGAGTAGSGTATFGSTGKTGGGATAILFSGTITPNIVTGNGVTPQLTTSSAFTLD